jgi:hypothetical protein
VSYTDDMISMHGIGAPEFLGEAVLHSGPANLWRSVEAASGTLTLTNIRLHFRPHGLAIQGGDLSIPLTEIARVELGSSLWVIPNQIVVSRRGGRTHKIVVWGRDEWITRIRHAMRG